MAQKKKVKKTASKQKPSLSAKKPSKKAAKAKPEKKTQSKKKPVAAKGKVKKAIKKLAIKAKVTKVKAKVALKAVSSATKKKSALKEKKVQTKTAELLVEVPAPVSVKIPGKKKKSGRTKSETKTGASGKIKCRDSGCDSEPLISGYCRLHYIKNWRKLKRKEHILASGQLNNYVEELVNKYPDKYLDVIRQDLYSDKDWAKVVTDLDLDANSEDDAELDEDLDGVVTEGVRRPSNDRGFDDEDGGDY